MTAAVVAFAFTAAEVVSAAYTVAKTVDTVAGTHLVTPKAPKPKVKGALTGYKSEAAKQSFVTGADDLAVGFRNYVKSVASVAPHYIQREKGDLRRNYDRAVAAREQILTRESGEFKTLGRPEKAIQSNAR
jgi:hypothetical protein